MRVLSVVGARPQFVKAGVLSREFRKRGIDELLVHTGQHYDAKMSDVFFAELELPDPHRHLGVGSGAHGAQTGEMMIRLESVVQDAAPDCVLVYGDTNSTLAGALVGAKLRVPVVHVEAGLRSFDRRMPEEINRLIADRVADLLLVPSASAAAQLRREGVESGIEVVGDLMIDLALETAERMEAEPPVLRRLGVRPGSYAVATIHRAGNTDDSTIFARLIAGLRQTGLPVVFPVHPRTRPLATTLCVGQSDNIIPTQPLSYNEMIALERNARCVITDSGGMQKESVVLGTPCVTVRDTTEWTETLEGGWNVLVGDDPAAIAAAARRPRPQRPSSLARAGGCAARICDAMARHLAAREYASA